MTKFCTAGSRVRGLRLQVLPAIKTNLKELLPIVDKLPIQYVAEKVVATGTDADLCNRT